MLMGYIDFIETVCSTIYTHTILPSSTANYDMLMVYECDGA